MEIHLWRREWRGGDRRWHLRPWLVPMITLWAVLLLALGLMWIDDLLTERASPRGLSLGRLGDPIFPAAMDLYLISLPQLALAIWIVWMVVNTAVRDRELGIARQLAVTPISPRTVALSKALAPTSLAIVTITLLAAVEAWGLTESSKIRQSESLLWRLGHTQWFWIMSRSWYTGYEHPMAVIWRSVFAVELILRGLLMALTVATLALRVAASSGSVVRSFSLTCAWAVGLVVLVWLLDWEMYRLLWRDSLAWTEVWNSHTQRGEVRGLWSIRFEYLWDLLIHIAAPLFWLRYWWRWTARGFPRVYFQEP
ncbi:hypothetical protein JXA47_11535 [Candidatus Sumerlaeota bacterium]|nr:hypothetical protein [Candidatus Sumerlaeota bacterium]